MDKFYNMDTKITKVIDIQQLWDSACTELALEFPIFGQLILQIGVRFVWDQSNKHMAWTDGSKITVNEAFIQYFCANPKQVDDTGTVHNMNISKKELEFVLCHELMHLLGLSFDRGTRLGIVKGTYSKELQAKWKLWNKATDYEINSQLSNNQQQNSDGYYSHKPVGNMPSWVLYSSKYKDMTAEEIYEDLLKDYEKHPENYTFDKDDEDDGGNCVGGLPGLDRHMPILDDTTRNELIQKIANVTSSTSQGYGSTAVSRLLDIAFKPIPFNWKKALQRYIRNWIKDNYTWNKPSRAGIAAGLILPSSSTTPCMHIGVAIDTSGSVGDNELQTMMNHLFTILGQFKQFTVDVWCNSTQVHEDTWKRFNASNKREIKEYAFQSDGGTDLKKSFEFIEKKYRNEKLDLLLYMTDGCDYDVNGSDSLTCKCPVIWLIMDNNDFKKPTKIPGAVYPFVVEREKAGY